MASQRRLACALVERHSAIIIQKTGLGDIAAARDAVASELLPLKKLSVTLESRWYIAVAREGVHKCMPQKTMYPS